MFCSFCIVPSTRGREISRTAAEIVAESRDLVASGIREISLLGQTVNAYGRHDRGRAVARSERNAARATDLPSVDPAGLFSRACCVGLRRFRGSRDSSLHQPASDLLRRRTHPRARRTRRALSTHSPACPERVRSNPRADEAAAYGRRVPPPGRSAAREPPGSRGYHGFDRRLSRRNRCRFCRHPQVNSGCLLYRLVFIQVFATSRNRCGIHDGRSLRVGRSGRDWRSSRISNARSRWTPTGLESGRRPRFSWRGRAGAVARSSRGGIPFHRVVNFSTDGGILARAGWVDPSRDRGRDPPLADRSLECGPRGRSAVADREDGSATCR